MKRLFKPVSGARLRLFTQVIASPIAQIFFLSVLDLLIILGLLAAICLAFFFQCRFIQFYIYFPFVFSTPILLILFVFSFLLRYCYRQKTILLRIIDAFDRLPGDFGSLLVLGFVFKFCKSVVFRIFFMLVLAAVSGLYYAGVFPAPAVDHDIQIDFLSKEPRSFYGEVSYDGRYLILSHCYDANISGITRLDLLTGEKKTILLPHYIHEHFLTTLSETNRCIAVNFESEAPSNILIFSIEPFRLLTDLKSEVADLRPYRYRGSEFVLLSMDNRYRRVSIERLLAKAAGSESDAPISEVGQQLTGMFALQMMVPLASQTNLAWMISEFGRYIHLVDLEAGRLVKTVKTGGNSWDATLDPVSRTLIVTRAFRRKIDFRRAETGELIDSLPLRGIPRAIIADPQRRLLFVGMYVGNRITIIDLDTHEILGFIPSFTRGRTFQMDRARNRLLAIGDQVYAYPLSQFDHWATKRRR